MSTNVIAPPATQRSDAGALDPGLIGRIRDVDMHEMFPARLWVEEFGDFVKPLADLFERLQPQHIPNSLSAQFEDVGAIDQQRVATSWSKACLAPGSYDMNRRLEVMDIAGIKETLLFGSALPIAGIEFASGTSGLASLLFPPGTEMPFEMRPMGRMMVKAYNDWCIRTANLSDRLRPVATVLTDTLKGALEETERLLDAGIRAICIPTGDPIEGKAPAHPDNDVLWSLLAANNAPVLLHIGGEKAFLSQPAAWVNCPQFYSNTTLPTELNIDPFSMATCHMAAQNFLTNVVLGGVFERVPNLRMGFMEMGANWVGPTAENMDMWVEEFKSRFSKTLSMSPSDYVRRNVRVSPFTFEPIGRYLENYPFLEDVLCFSTDYPHYEGGTSPIEDMAERIKPFGPEATEKFFVSNAEWIMP